MQRCRIPWRFFSWQPGVPFAVSVVFFVFSQRRSLLMEPEVYIASLKRTGSAFHMISLGMWKYFLARDPLCREAEVIVMGSSRVSEIDATVVGTSICNLYVDGLSAPGFAHLVHGLSPLGPGQHRTVYVGLDHFWLWVNTDPFDNVELKLLSQSRTLWRIWARRSTRLLYRQRFP